MTAETALRRLTTRRLILRAPGISDVDRIVAALCDAEVVRWLARVPWPYTRETAMAWIEGADTGAKSGDEHAFAIDNGDGLIGMISIRDLKSDGEFGYWLGRQWWGNGLMTEAVSAVLAHGFDTVGLDAINSGVFEGNSASLAIQKKFGFQITGTSRQHSQFYGRELDHIDTRLTAIDYRRAAA